MVVALRRMRGKIPGTVPLDVLVLREHAEEIEHREHNIHEQRRAVGNKTAERYLPQFKDHVKSLKFKTAMHDAVDAHESIQSFRKRTRWEQGLDEAIESSLRRDPARALKGINVQDAQITTELQAIEKDVADLKAFIDGISKHPIPKIDG
jgi:hypothetical protein